MNTYILFNTFPSATSTRDASFGFRLQEQDSDLDYVLVRAETYWVIHLCGRDQNQILKNEELHSKPLRAEVEQGFMGAPTRILTYLRIEDKIYQKH